MASIDLNAPTIPANQRVWRLFPGNSYKFLGEFIQQKVGFLDLPGLDLPEGQLRRAHDLIPRIALSAKYKDFLYSNEVNFKPELNLADFQSARHTQNRGRVRQAIINFFDESKQNDLVVLPEPIYMSRVHIGRFLNDRRSAGFFSRVYGDLPIPAREIEWLSSYQENMVSSALSQSLRHQHPFTLLEMGLYVEVFSLAFSSFIFGDRHVSTIYNREDFLDADSSLLGHVSRLSSAACATVFGERGSLSIDDLIAVLLENPPIHLTSTQESDIHSPGFTRWISGSIVCLVAAAVIGALIFLSQHSDDGPTLEQEMRNLEFVNLAPGADAETTNKVSAASKLVLESFGLEVTLKLCKACRSAHDRAGLRSSASSR